MSQLNVPLRRPLPPNYERRVVSKRVVLFGSIGKMEDLTLGELINKLKMKAEHVGADARLDFTFDPDEPRDTTLHVVYSAPEGDLEYESRIKSEERLWEQWNDPEYQKKLKALENAQKKAEELKKELGIGYIGPGYGGSCS